jgi:hypothetical protein
MSRPNHDGMQGARDDEIVRLAALIPDDEMTDLPPDVAFRLVMAQRRDPDEDGAGMPVPAPHRPSPDDSAIALPLPSSTSPNRSYSARPMPTSRGG